MIAVLERVVEPLEHEHPRPFADDEPSARWSNGAGRPRAESARSCEKPIWV